MSFMSDKDSCGSTYSVSLPSFFAFQGKKNQAETPASTRQLHKIIPYFIHYITSKYSRGDYGGNYLFFYNSVCEASQTYTIFNSNFGPAIQQLRPASIQTILVSFSHYQHLSASLNVCFLTKKGSCDRDDYDIYQEEYTNIGRGRDTSANQLYKKNTKYNKLHDELQARCRSCQHEEFVWPFMFVEICFMNFKIPYQKNYLSICDWKKTDFESYASFVKKYFDILCSIYHTYYSTFGNRFPQFFHHFMNHRSTRPQKRNKINEEETESCMCDHERVCEIILGRDGTGYAMFQRSDSEETRIERYNPMLDKILERKGYSCRITQAVNYDQNELEY